MMERLLRGASWTLGAAVVSQSLGFAGGVLAARILGGAGFGQLTAIRGLLVAFGLFSGAGLGLAAVKYVAELRDGDLSRLQERIRFLLRLSWVSGICAAVVAAGLTPWMARGWLRAGELSEAMWLGAPLILFSGLSAIQNGILGGLQKFRYIAQATVVESTCNLSGVVIGALLGGVAGAIGGACLAGAVAWIYRNGLLRKELATLPAPKDTAVALDKGWLLHEAMPFILAGAITQPFEWFARITLARQAGGFDQLGLFMAAYTCAQLVLFLPRQFTTPGIALLANMMAQGPAAEVHRFSTWKLRTSLLLASCIAIPMVLAGDWILGWFGFHDGSDVLVMLVLAQILGSYSLVFRSVLYAAGKMWSQCVQLLGWCLMLAAGWWWLRDLGAWGLATAYLLAFAVHIIFQGLEAGQCLRRARGAEQDFARAE